MQSTTYAHQYSRRLKMQFLTEMESMDNKTARILLIGTR
jgi:hypothetical protein